jgi:hypothetical protein
MQTEFEPSPEDAPALPAVIAAPYIWREREIKEITHGAHILARNFAGTSGLSWYALTIMYILENDGEECAKLCHRPEEFNRRVYAWAVANNITEQDADAAVDLIVRMNKDAKAAKVEAVATAPVAEGKA